MQLVVGHPQALWVWGTGVGSRRRGAGSTSALTAGERAPPVTGSGSSLFSEHLMSDLGHICKTRCLIPVGVTAGPPAGEEPRLGQDTPEAMATRTGVTPASSVGRGQRPG